MTASPWRKWLLAVVTLLLMLGGQTVGFIAYVQSNHTANCVNGILGSRNAPASNDADSQIAFAKAIYRLISASPAQFAREQPRFKRATLHHIQVLTASQHTRAAHPLGRC